MKKIYFASPLFSEADRVFNQNITEKLREIGYEVFLPQESKENNDEVFDAKAIFLSNIQEVDRADFVIAVLEGTDPDSGTSFEAGYAYAKGKTIYGLRTDFRGTNDVIVNLMLTKACDQIFLDGVSLVNFFSHLRGKEFS